MTVKLEELKKGDIVIFDYTYPDFKTTTQKGRFVKWDKLNSRIKIAINITMVWSLNAAFVNIISKEYGYVQH